MQSVLLLFSCSAVPDSLRSHGLQHARLPCPSSSPRIGSNLGPSSRWCHPTISSSAAPFSSCPQSSPVSGAFPMNQLFTSCGHSTGASASASVLSPSPQLESIRSLTLALFMVQFSHPYMTTGKTIALTRRTFVSKVMSLLFNTLSRFGTAFLSRSKCLLILRLQSPSPVVLEAKKRKSVIVYAFFPIYLPWSDGTSCHDLSFLNVEF